MGSPGRPSEPWLQGTGHGPCPVTQVSFPGQCPPAKGPVSRDTRPGLYGARAQAGGAGGPALPRGVAGWATLL